MSRGKRQSVCGVRGGGVGAWLLLAAAALAFLTGCNNSFRDHRASLRDMYAQGRFDLAAKTLDSPEAQKLYGKNEALLYYLDRGAVALATDEPEKAIQMLEAAESIMESKFELTAGDQAAQWLINDNARPYIGEPYESMYVNVLKLLAQLQRGQIVGGATVEARRMASKANMLRDRYLQYEEAVRREGGAGFSQNVSRAMPANGNGAAGAGGGLMTVNRAGEFIESPLGTFLTIVTFMHSGEPQHQAVAARRLLDSMRLQRGLIGPVDPAQFEGLEEREPMPGDVLIVALSGRGPTKRAERIGPIPIFDWPLYFELPVLEGGSGEITSARITIETISGPTAGTPPEIVGLALVEDMAAVATENHRRQLPVIYQRALLRSSAKAAASFAGTQVIRHSGSRGGGGRGRSNSTDLAVLGSVIGGLVFLAVTERADLRSWVFLPGKAHVGLITLAPGEHRIRVEYLSARGGVAYMTPWRTVHIPEESRGEGEDLTTVVEQYWR